MNSVDSGIELIAQWWTSELIPFLNKFSLPNFDEYQTITLFGMIASPILILHLIGQWEKRKQRKKGQMLSKRGMHGIIRSQATAKITDLIEDLRYRNIISDDVAREAYDHFGLNLKLSGLLPKQETNAEVKRRLKAHGMGHSNDPVPLPDATSTQKVDTTAILAKFGIVKN